MQVLHLETGRHLYGGARQVLLLATGLQAQGIRSLVLGAAGGELLAAARAAGLETLPLRVAGDWDPRLALGVAAALRRHGPAILHIHGRRGADAWGLLAARRAGVPAVLSRRVDNPDVLARLRARYCARVVAISAGIARQLRADGVPPDRLRCVPSAVAPAACQPTWAVDRFRAEFGLRPGQPVIGVVAQFIPRKGHRRLWQALPDIRASCPEARVLLFGRGPLAAALRDEARHQGLLDMVQFAGYRPDLLGFLGHLDLLLHPADAEGLGLALLEAQAAGVPVVGFRIAGVSEAVADQVSGLLVPPGDCGALAAAANRLLWNPRLRARLSDGARHWVAERFSVADMVAGNLAVYREIWAGETA